MDLEIHDFVLLFQRQHKKMSGMITFVEGTTTVLRSWDSPMYAFVPSTLNKHIHNKRTCETKCIS